VRKGPSDVDRALRVVVRSAAAGIPFYRRLLAESRVDVQACRSARDLEHLPVVSREALVLDTPMVDRVHRRANPATWVSRLTSGSRGVPMHVVMSPWEARFRRFLLLRAWGQGRLPSLPLTVIDVGVRLDLSSEPEVRRYGPIRLVRVPLSTTQHENVHWIWRFPGAILAGYPSALVLLAEHLEGARRPRLRMVATRGELLHAETRCRLRKAFGSPVVDFYNCEEIGNVAWQCPADERSLHVNTDGCLVEVVGESGEPLPLGEEGRILVTNLYNCTMPLIRYDIQDRGVLLSRQGEACDCGSRLPRMGAVSGRDDDFLIRADGGRISPRLAATAWEHEADRVASERGRDAPFRRYAMVQDAADHLTIYVVPLRGERLRLEAAAEKAVKRLDPAMGWAVVAVGEIPPSAGGKFRKVRRDCGERRRTSP